MKKSFMSIHGRNNLSIAVLGPGGIGGLLACLFWKNGFETACISKSDAVDDLNKAGMRLKSAVFGDFTARPKFIPRLDFRPDILFVTVKANELAESLDSAPVKLIENSAIIPLLNGFEHLELIRGRLGKRVAAGMIGKVEAKKESPDVIAHPSPNVPEIEIASADLPRETLEKIKEVLEKIGIKTEIFENEKEVVWRKLARNNAIACVTAVTNQPLDFALNHPEWRKKLENCVREGAMVAKADGFDLDPEKVIAQIRALPENITSSLQRDINSGRDSELEAVPGAILRLAERHRIPCPAIKEIYLKLKRKYE